MSGAKYGGLIAATPGISNALGGSIMLLHSLTKSYYEPVRHLGNIIWMPKSYAKNADEAQRLIENMLKKAYLSNLPKKYHLSENAYSFKPTFGSSKDYHVTNIEGGLCSREKEVCRLVVVSNKPTENHLTPTWLSEEKSYFWSLGSDEPSAAAHITLERREEPPQGGVRFKHFYTHKYLLEVSKKLPEWIYIYSPSTKGRKYPVVYNKGEALYFISPKKEEPLKTANKGHKNKKQFFGKETKQSANLWR